MIAHLRAGWTEQTLGEFFRVKHGFAFKGEYFAESGRYVVLTPGNFYESGGFKSRNGKEKYYTGDIPVGFILHKNDLIVAMTEQAEGLLGSAALVPDDDKFLHNQRIGLVTDMQADRIDKLFLYYLFNCDALRMQLRATATGLKVRHTAPERIASVRLRMPVLATQKKIASILAAYDDLIENNTRRIAILEEMARALYREWFVDFRFPGHENVALVRSAVGDMPAGWKSRRLDEVADVNGRSIPKVSAPDEILYVDISSVSPGSVEKIDRFRFADAPGRARRLVQHGDIIWSTVRPNRRAHAVIMHPPAQLVVSTGFAVISGSTVPYTYLYHALTTDEFVGYLTNAATGAAYPAVTGRDFEAAMILEPAGELLEQFHHKVEPLFETRHNFQRRNRKLHATRELLLPKLVSGEVDVSELDIDLGQESA